MSTGSSKELVLVGKAPEPSITKIEGGLFAVGKDSQTIFVNANGDPPLKYAVKWPEPPTALGIKYFHKFTSKNMLYP